MLICFQKKKEKNDGKNGKTFKQNIYQFFYVLPILDFNLTFRLAKVVCNLSTFNFPVVESVICN